MEKRSAPEGGKETCESTGPTLTSELHRLMFRVVVVCCAAACTAAVLLARCCSPGAQACLPDDPTGLPCLMVIWHTVLLAGCGWVWGRGMQLLCGCASQTIVASAVLTPWALWGPGAADMARASASSTAAAVTAEETRALAAEAALHPPDGECCCCASCCDGGTLALSVVLLSTSLLLAVLVFQARKAGGHTMTLLEHTLVRVNDYDEKWHAKTDTYGQVDLSLNEGQWLLKDGSVSHQWPACRSDGVKVRAHELPMMIFEMKTLKSMMCC